MNKLFGNEKFWLLLLILLLLPFIILSFYTHPSADDYIFAAMINEKGIVKYFFQVYYEWSGRYFAFFLNCINPLIYEWIWGYKLIPVFLISLFYYSIYYFVHTIFSRELKAIRKHCISLVFVLLYFNCIPSTSECIYWMDGSLCYFLANILMVFLFTFLLKSWENKKLSLFSYILFILIPLMIAGSNEVSMLMMDALLFIAILIFHFNKKKIFKGLIIAFIAAIVGTIAEVTAPGNYFKMNNFFSHNLDILFSLKCSFISFFKIAGQFIQDSSFIMITLLFITIIPIFFRNEIVKKLIRFSPFITIPISLFLLIILYFPVTYSTGLNPALRIHDCVGFFFLPLWFYNLTVLHFYLIKKNKINILELPAYMKNLIAAAAFILTVTSFTKEPGKQIICDGNIFRSFYDLFYNAKVYNDELNHRYDLIKMAKEKNIKIIHVPALTKFPETIYFIDITDDASHWINLCDAKYFGLDSIKITH